MREADALEGGSALHVAAGCNSLRVVRVLLRRTPDAKRLLAARDHNGRTALEVAGESPDLRPIVDWMTEWGVANGGGQSCVLVCLGCVRAWVFLSVRCVCRTRSKGDM